MNVSRFETEFSVYNRWRNGLVDLVAKYGQWLKEQKLGDGALVRRLQESVKQVHEDNLKVAFVAEFSRGKSELINAIFFGAQKRRVLPANAGRTTMCPTELRYDPKLAASIRLLPIETRTTDVPLAEYYEQDHAWSTFELPLDDPEGLTEALAHVTEVNRATQKQAKAMGLDVELPDTDRDSPHVEDRIVLIPRWRHAIINYPHPLLEEGLVILDTPGLNALGAEPELTFGMLSSAHAVVFLLAADSGVTKSDLSVWRDHVCAQLDNNNENKLVVLNKVDVLWDDLRDEAEFVAQVENQVRVTTSTLNVEEQRVFPLSAQKALLGRVRDDQALVDRSGIVEFEQALADVMIPAKRSIMRSRLRAEIGDIVSETRNMLKGRINEVTNHKKDLEKLSGRNEEASAKLVRDLQVEKARFETNFRRYQASRSIFTAQTNRLYEHLDITQMDAVVEEYREKMTKSMTTSGMRQHMRRFLEITSSSMDAAAGQTAEIREMATGMYKMFAKEHGMPQTVLREFSTVPYQREIRNVAEQHSHFVRGFAPLVTEQHLLTRRYYQAVMSKVRKMFERANEDAQKWLNTVLAPLETQIREHNSQLRRRVDAVKRIYQSTEGVEGRLTEISQQHKSLSRQFKMQEAYSKQIESWLADPTETQAVEKQQRTMTGAA